jgi:hypothetical protein
MGPAQRDPIWWGAGCARPPTRISGARNGAGGPDLPPGVQARRAADKSAAAMLRMCDRSRACTAVYSACRGPLAQRRITYLLRRALGDLFLGPYGVAGSGAEPGG